MSDRQEMAAGQSIDLKIEAIAYGGDGVGRHAGFVIFVPFAAPGDLVRVRVTERRKNYARAEIQEVIEASPVRTKPLCSYFGVCGGCQLQHIAYAAQLDAKAKIVRDALHRIGGIGWADDIRVLHGEEYGYRARANLKLRSPRVGFNRVNSKAVCDVESCPVLLPKLNGALGMLHELTRAGQETGRSEVSIAADENGVAFEPRISGLPVGPLMRSVAGADYLFSPSSFFQGNALMTEDLVSQVVEGRSGSLAIDLYAGVGLFTVQLARRFDQVVGVELSARAASFARRNIAAAAETNVQFVCRLAEEWLGDYVNRLKSDQVARPDLVVLNPPRTGAAASVTQLLLLRPSTVVYVSCDPPTLARDLAVLVSGGYQIETVTALDMFPQTFHIESVVSLRAELN